MQEQIESYLSHLRHLRQRGQEWRERLGADPSNPSSVVGARAWQEDCGVTINQLSGGSKAHWLARAFSEAFLKRSGKGQAAEGAPPQEIVQRLLDVLEQAADALSRASDGQPLATVAGPAPRRFDFVHNGELRTILEEAYAESREALERADFDASMRTSCGILEAIVTDALGYSGEPAGNIAKWPFEKRLAIAERAGLIRAGWARLTVVAREYRDHAANGGAALVTERDARFAAQVLHVVMRDLNPGR